jgi:hypothetical protein
MRTSFVLKIAKHRDMTRKGSQPFPSGAQFLSRHSDRHFMERSTSPRRFREPHGYTDDSAHDLGFPRIGKPQHLAF